MSAFKSILVIDTPTTCTSCPFYQEKTTFDETTKKYHTEFICWAMTDRWTQEEFDKSKSEFDYGEDVHPDCPLKKTYEFKDKNYYNEHSEEYVEGWNACLEEIEG